MKERTQNEGKQKTKWSRAASYTE